jgi:hypothetical protein
MRRMGRIRIKTLRQALAVISVSMDQNRILTVDEIIQVIHCRKANAYNYQRFLRSMLPDGRLYEDRPVGDEQRCLM